MQSFRCHTSLVAEQPEELQAFVRAVIAVVMAVDHLFTLQMDKGRGVYRGEGEIGESGKDVSLYQPYTVLDIPGLIQTPYHESYAPEISPLVVQLRELATMCRKIHSPGFSAGWWEGYFEAIAEGFLGDGWPDVERFFLTLPPQEKYLLSIGPIERYHDSRLGCRRFYTAVFLYRNPAYTAYQQLWADASEEYLSEPDLWYLPRATPHVPRLFVGDVLAEGGEVAALHAEAWSRPEDSTIAATHGAIKMIMVNTSHEKAGDLAAAASKTIRHFVMCPDQREIDLKDLTTACMTGLILHEMGHTFLKPEGATERLGEFYTLFEEARAEINSLYLCWRLEQRGLVPSGRTRQILIADLALLHYKHQRFVRTGFRAEYLYSTVLWYAKAEQFGLISVLPSGNVQVNESTIERQLGLFIGDIFTFLNTAVRSAHRANRGPLFDYRTTMIERCAHYCSVVRN